MKRLIDLVLTHDNDYGFDPSIVLSTFIPQVLPSFSFVIPYYESGPIVKKTVDHLYNSIRTVQSFDSKTQFEVILVDDGSQKQKLSDFIKTDEKPNLKVITSVKNQGRTTSRNLGLKRAKNEVCFFMDSDILIDDLLVMNALKLHAYNRLVNGKSCITVGFFLFTDENDPLVQYKIITPADIKINDYRLFCTYSPTWIHADEDKEFIGQSFSIVHETNFFRSWKGKYKAWVLPLMAMGGFFAVNRKEAVDIGGFNESFKGYGYTETSVPTKLIATHDNFLIPILVGGGVHVEDKVVNITREEKDRIFKLKHDFYYNKFMQLNLQEARKDVL